MGLLKDSLKVIQEIVTLGGASRLEDAKRDYKKTHDEYLVLLQKAEDYRAEVQKRVTAIGAVLTEAKKYLGKSELLIEQSLSDRSGLIVCYGTQTLKKVNRFNSGFNSAINVGAGTIAGGSLAVGSWALIASLGSASTGAVISGLSGVAATNATLAWFGGGALAAGGAGMAGGAAVLGGLFAVPLVYIAAKGSHKKAKDLEAAKTQLDETVLQVRDQIEAYPAFLSAVKDKELKTSRLCEAFISSVVRYSADIRPHGILSAAKQKLLKLMGKEPFTKEQTKALELLAQSVTTFLTDLGIHGGEVRVLEGGQSSGGPL